MSRSLARTRDRGHSGHIPPQPTLAATTSVAQTIVRQCLNISNEDFDATAASPPAYVQAWEVLPPRLARLLTRVRLIVRHAVAYVYSEHARHVTPEEEADQSTAQLGTIDNTNPSGRASRRNVTNEAEAGRATAHPGTIDNTIDNTNASIGLPNRESRIDKMVDDWLARHTA